MSVVTPPCSRWRMSARLASGARPRSARRASGGTARTEADRSAGVTAEVFTAAPGDRIEPSILSNISAQPAAGEEPEGDDREKHDDRVANDVRRGHEGDADAQHLGGDRH